MTLSEDIFAALTGGSPAPLRVYPDVLPSNVVLPAITYKVVAGVDDYHLLGRSHLARVLVRVDVWATVKLTTETIMENEIIPLMEQSALFTVNAIDITPADGDFEEDTERYRASREFTIWRAS